MARNERTDWLDIWYEDRQYMLNTMTRNMVADLDAGYDYFGNSITKQRAMIEEYKRETDDQMEAFKFMNEAQVNHWCYIDLKRRGAIA